MLNSLAGGVSRLPGHNRLSRPLNRCIRPSASAGKEPQKPDDKTKPKSPNFITALQNQLPKLSPKQQVFVSLLVGGGALSGSLAISIAYSINTALAFSGRAPGSFIDPLGGFSINYSLLPTALALALPILLLDAGIMLTDWGKVKESVAEDDAKKILDFASNHLAKEAQEKEAKLRQLGGRGTDEPAMAVKGAPSTSSPASPATSTPEQFSVGLADLPAILVEAAKMQKESLVSNNAGRLLTPTEEGAVVASNALGESMKRAVLIQALGGWFADRIYEGGLDELLTSGAGLGGWHPTVEEAGRAGALVLLLLYALSITASRVISTGKRGLMAVRIGPDGQKADDVLGKALAQRMTVRIQCFNVLVGLRRLLDTGCSTGAYLVTGNLFAPVVVEAVTEGLLCVWQRRGLRDVENERKEKVKKIQQAVTKLKSARSAADLKKALGETALPRGELEALEAGAGSRANVRALEEALGKVRSLAERYEKKLSALERQLANAAPGVRPLGMGSSAPPLTLTIIPPRDRTASPPGTPNPDSPASSTPPPPSPDSPSPSASQEDPQATQRLDSSSASTSAPAPATPARPTPLGPVSFTTTAPPGSARRLSLMDAKVLETPLAEMGRSVHSLTGVLATLGGSLDYLLSNESPADLLDRADGQRLKADLPALFDALNGTRARVEELRGRCEELLLQDSKAGKDGEGNDGEEKAAVAASGSGAGSDKTPQ